MDRKEKIEKVSSDLPALKKLSHSIDTLLCTKKKHEIRIEHLKRERDKSVGDLRNQLDEDIKRLETFLSSLCINELIREATAMEQKYIQAINRLPTVDRIIILDGYINGVPYWKVGKTVGYTERGVQYRVRKIIEALADEIQ